MKEKGIITYRQPVQCRQIDSKQYIKQALNENDQQKLDFICSEAGRGYHIMTKNIMTFLVKTAPFKNNIYALDLNNCHLNDEMLKMLTKGLWHQLRQLYLYKNYLTGLSLQYLKHGSWKKLQIMQMGKNPIVNIKGRLVLYCIPKTIRHLQFSSLSINANFMKDIQFNNWQLLKSFHLQYNILQNQGLNYLVKGNWPNLQTLNMENNFITNDGMKTLRKGVWKQLKTLGLRGNLIDHNGIELLSGNMWPLMESLDLRSKLYLNGEIRYDVEKHIYTSVIRSLLKFDKRDLSVQNIYPSSYENENIIQKMVDLRGCLRIL